MGHPCSASQARRARSGAYVVPTSRHAVLICPSSCPRRRHAVHGAAWPSIPQQMGGTTCMTLPSWMGELIMEGTAVLRL